MKHTLTSVFATGALLCFYSYSTCISVFASIKLSKFVKCFLEYFFKDKFFKSVNEYSI
jgi:hypothetical protein